MEDPDLGVRELRSEVASVSTATIVLVAAGAVIYPATLLADNGARFPKASDCVLAPARRTKVLVVFGHVPSYQQRLLVQKTLAELGIERVAEDLVPQLADHGFPAHLEAQPSP